MIMETNYKFLGDSFHGTAVKNTTTTFEYELVGPWMVYGAEMIYSGAVDGDYVEMSVVDKNNVLGYGADTVIANWIARWFVPYSQNYWLVQSNVVSTIPTGLFIRLRYISVGTSVDVPIKVNLRMIRA